jgi:hypothetical protein
MARLLVALALLGAAFVHANPTPQTLPRVVLGLFASQPEKDVNFEEFTKGLELNHPFTKGTTLGVREEGDRYVLRFYSWATNVTVELPFKLGETQTTVIRGKNVEYVATLDGNTEQPVLRLKFRETDGDKKFTVDAAFSETGINATYTRNDVVAKRSYRRTLPPYALGAFQAVPSRLSPNYVEFLNRVYPLPTGLTWTETTAFYLAREGDSYVEKFAPNPSYYVKVKFQLNQPGHLKIGDEDVEYKVTVTSSTPRNTTVHSEYTSTRGRVTSEAVFDEEGVTLTHTTTTGVYTAYYKRIVPYSFYGTFEEVPEKTENFAEYTAGNQGSKLPELTTRQRLYRQGDNYVIHKELRTGNPVQTTFTLNTPSTLTTADNQVYEYQTSVLGLKDDVVLRVRGQLAGTEKTLVADYVAKADGLQATYRRGDVTAKKFYRRVLQKAVFGTYESTPDNEEFKTFANAVGHPGLLKKTTIVLTETPTHQYTQTITPEGGPSQTLTFTLGERGNVETNGKTVQYQYYYYEVDNVPYLRSAYFENDTLKFQAAAAFRPDGYTVTYAYGNKVATRTYTRQGPAVPLEPLPSA